MLRIMVCGFGISLLLGTTACTSARVQSRTTTQETVVTHRHGPPPHAPAHGYRAKTEHGVEVIYDRALQVYVVVGRKHCYYADGAYYRTSGDRWEVSVRLDRGWKKIKASKLPQGLRVASNEKERDKDKGKGKGRTATG